MRRGRVGLCVATQIARYVAPRQSACRAGTRRSRPGRRRRGSSRGIARWKSAASSLPITDRAALDRAPAHAGSARRRAPGADRLRAQPRRRRLDRDARGTSSARYAQGLRAVGPAHYGPGVYAQGTDATGGIGARGRELLREMERLGIILDATHLCDDSFRDALDHFRRRRSGRATPTAARSCRTTASSPTIRSAS